MVTVTDGFPCAPALEGILKLAFSPTTSIILLVSSLPGTAPGCAVTV